jgi:tRNA(adenine34) deaminase
MPRSRRSILGLFALGPLAAKSNTNVAAQTPQPGAFAISEAHRMRDLAVNTGDQAFGAVVVLDGRIIGYGPSRVVLERDSEAHAERVAIREALIQMRQTTLPGAVLVSTSRACAACERVAFRAGIARMYYGPNGRDGGAPEAK